MGSLAEHIPYNSEVWEEMKNIFPSFQGMEFKDIDKVEFFYGVGNKDVLPYVEVRKRGKCIKTPLSREQAEELSIGLCSTFDISWRAINEIRIILKSDDCIPIFQLKVYPVKKREEV